jgi:hypothetical protein
LKFQVQDVGQGLAAVPELTVRVVFDNPNAVLSRKVEKVLASFR